MSDQTQEESVSLHPYNNTPQPSVVEPAVVGAPIPQVVVSPQLVQPEQPQIQPTVPQMPPTQQATPEVQADERTTPFVIENYQESQYAEKFSTVEPVTWTASEYIAHKKHLSWYLALGAIVVVLAVIIYLITGGDTFSTVSVLVLAIIFGVYAGRPPREQEYVIDERGVSIGTRTYEYNVIKSFSVIEEGPFSSIVFVPMKRFMPLISIYYDPADEEKIVTYLSSVIPMEYRKRDNIERLMHKIKF